MRTALFSAVMALSSLTVLPDRSAAQCGPLGCSVSSGYGRPVAPDARAAAAPRWRLFARRRAAITAMSMMPAAQCASGARSTPPAVKSPVQQAQPVQPGAVYPERSDLIAP
jgi:hypothetical protein